MANATLALLAALSVTALAPLMHGTRTFRIFLSSYSDEPGWRVVDLDPDAVFGSHLQLTESKK